MVHCSRSASDPLQKLRAAAAALRSPGLRATPESILPEVRRRPTGWRAALVVAALAVGSILPAGAPRAAVADALQISQLEQDLLALRREVERQARRLESLERAARMSRVPRRPPADAVEEGDAPDDADPAWFEAENWAQLRRGMDELAVIRLLGPPTSMRVSDDGTRRTLFYALEIGASGYLAGSVVLEDRQLVSHELPRLR